MSHALEDRFDLRFTKANSISETVPWIRYNLACDVHQQTDIYRARYLCDRLFAFWIHQDSSALFREGIADLKEEKTQEPNQNQQHHQNHRRP